MENLNFAQKLSEVQFSDLRGVFRPNIARYNNYLDHWFNGSMLTNNCAFPNVQDA